MSYRILFSLLGLVWLHGRPFCATTFLNCNIVLRNMATRTLFISIDVCWFNTIQSTPFGSRYKWQCRWGGGYRCNYSACSVMVSDLESGIFELSTNSVLFYCLHFCTNAREKSMKPSSPHQLWVKQRGKLSCLALGSSL